MSRAHRPKTIGELCKKCGKYRGAAVVLAEKRIDIHLNQKCKSRVACEKDLTERLTDVLARDVKALAAAEAKKDRKRAKREAKGL